MGLSGPIGDDDDDDGDDDDDDTNECNCSRGAG